MRILVLAASAANLCIVLRATAGGQIAGWQGTRAAVKSRRDLQSNNYRETIY